MKKLVYVFFLLINYIFLLSETIIPAGNISGDWLINGSPYLIEGEITIPNGETLTIDPGVIVEFQGHYKFNVQGQLLALGTLQDSIIFTVADTTGYYNFSHSGWHAIRFDNTPTTNDSSKFCHCRFEYAKAVGPELEDWLGGVFYINNYSKVQIANSTLYHNFAESGGAGIYCTHYSSPVIEFNDISYNNSISEDPGGGSGCGISLYNNSSPIIRNNIISFNNAYIAVGIRVWGSYPTITNNIISFNSGIDTAGIQVSNMGELKTLISNNLIYGNQAAFRCGGIRCDSDSVTFINNTIVNNDALIGGGLVIWCSDVVLINNNIWGNTANSGNQVYLEAIDIHPDFYNCNIEGGVNAFGGDGATGFNGEYEDCIDSYPFFVDSLNYDFSLQDTSPCIGAGVDEIEIDDNWYYAPELDIEGNPRPNPTGSFPDIGAYENLLGEPQVGIFNNQLPVNNFNLSNFPNPFNPTTTIEFSVQNNSEIELIIFNLKGQKIKTLASNVFQKGSHSIIWNGDNELGKPVSSGIYYYKLIINGKIEVVKKCLLLK